MNKINYALVFTVIGNVLFEYIFAPAVFALPVAFLFGLTSTNNLITAVAFAAWIRVVLEYTMAVVASAWYAEKYKRQK